MAVVTTPGGEVFAATYPIRPPGFRVTIVDSKGNRLPLDVPEVLIFGRVRRKGLGRADQARVVSLLGALDFWVAKVERLEEFWGATPGSAGIPTDAAPDRATPNPETFAATTFHIQPKSINIDKP